MKYLVFLLMCLSLTNLAAQDRFSVLGGGLAGVRKVEGSEFRDVYGNNKFTYGFILGVGNGETYIGAKYRIMNVSDASATINGITYSAEWKERILVAGFHYYPSRIPLHFEAGYAWLTADETRIPRTGSSFVPQSRTLKDGGLDFVGGISFGHDIRVNVDLGYLLLLKKGSASAGSLPNLGGFYYGASICYLL